MFSFVQNITSVLKPYETKAVDARLKRRGRDDSTAPQDHKAPKHSEVVSEAQEGQVLSVESLILFLEDFLESRLDSKLNSGSMVDDDSFAPWLKQEHSNNNTNAAAQAYAHCAKTAQRNHRTKPVKTDLSLVYGLIRDLRRLKALGVKVLRLDEACNFIEGISAAVLAEKERLHN